MDDTATFRDTAALVHDAPLPLALPLDHDLFLDDAFDVDDFLLARRHTSLDDLRSELRTYLSRLRNELVGVINEDYEDFIGLGIGLRGTDKRLERMRRPVEDVRTEIEATLRLLLSINDSVIKVEALLLIESPQDTDLPVASTSKLDPASSTVALSRTKGFDRSPGSSVKRIERVATEYSQLLYLVEKASGTAFLHTLKARIDIIRQTLQRDMAALLSGALHAKPASSETLHDIMRIFARIKCMQDAEDVVRKELVRPWLQKHVTRDSLSAPQSPMIPETPGIAKSFFPSSASSSSQNDTSAFLPIATSSADPLVDVYNKILAFISRDCAAVLEASDRRLRGNFLVTVVWEELQSRLVAELGHLVFAAGRPEGFHSNYMTTQMFIVRLENLCPTLKQLDALRNTASFAAFGKRWQLPVYYQLRFKDIAYRLEETLANKGGLDCRASIDSPFLLASTEATHRAIWTCWQNDVILAELTPRFWRLTLQILMRYKRWLDDVVPLHFNVNGHDSIHVQPDPHREREKLGSASPVTRAGTPAREASEQAGLQQLTVLVVDVRRLEAHVLELFASTISVHLPALMSESESTPEAALRSTTSTVSAVAPSLVSQIAVALVKQCNESLRPSLRSVLTEVRASIKSAPPSTPSYLVPRVLKPLKSFFDHFPGRELDTPSRAAVAGEVLDEIAGRYASVLVDNREAEASLRRLKRGRQGFSLFGRSTPAITDADGGGEEINVKVQLQLDAESFEQEAMALDVKIDEGAGFKALRAAVH